MTLTDKLKQVHEALVKLEKLVCEEDYEDSGAEYSLALLPEIIKEVEWQDISTVPKGFAEILGINSSLEIRKTWRDQFGDFYYYNDIDGDRIWQPTHYKLLDLPKQPKKVEG